MKRKTDPIIKEFRKKSDKELIKLKKNLEFTKTKASSMWEIKDVKNKEVGINVGWKAGSGDKTSLRKDIRRTIAKINTILQERNSEKLCEKGHIPKRRKRRLRGKGK